MAAIRLFLEFYFIYRCLVISDTICELGGASELANYGEYSGAPTESQTYQYAMTILKLLADGEPRPDGAFS